MLVITIELWPRGDRSKAKVLGRGTIANVGGSATRGEYFVALSRRSGKNSFCLWREGKLQDFPRKRLGHWDLLYRALKDIVGERNGGSAVLVHLVRHEQVPAFTAEGWSVRHDLSDCHHGDHAVMMARPLRAGEVAEESMREIARLST